MPTDQHLQHATHHPPPTAHCQHPHRLFDPGHPPPTTTTQTAPPHSSIHRLHTHLVGGQSSPENFPALTRWKHPRITHGKFYWMQALQPQPPPIPHSPTIHPITHPPTHPITTPHPRQPPRIRATPRPRPFPEATHRITPRIGTTPPCHPATQPHNHTYNHTTTHIRPLQPPPPLRPTIR